MVHSRVTAASVRPSGNVILTKAALRAADRVEVTAKTLASIIGVSEATVSRMKKGEFALERGTKPFELAALAVRLFRSPDAIAGGDEDVPRAWLRNRHRPLD